MAQRVHVIINIGFGLILLPLSLQTLQVVTVDNKCREDSYLHNPFRLNFFFSLNFPLISPAINLNPCILPTNLSSKGNRSLLFALDSLLVIYRSSKKYSLSIRKCWKPSVSQVPSVEMRNSRISELTC